MIGLYDYDRLILMTLHSSSLSSYHTFFLAITQLGNSVLWIVIAALVFAMGDHNRRKVSAILIISLLFSMVVVEDVKNIIQRPRPLADNLNVLLFKSYSFPSGHAQTAFIVMYIIGAYLEWKYKIIGYFLAIMVSLSRIYLGVHYPSDVVAGAILGIVMGEMVVFATYRLGLSSNTGIISSIVPMPAMKALKRTGSTLSSMVKPERSRILYILLSIGLALIAISYMTGHYAATLVAIAVLAMIIILALSSPAIVRRKPYMQYIAIASTGLTLSVSSYVLSQYWASLSIILIMYMTFLLLPGRTEVENQTSGG